VIAVSVDSVEESARLVEGMGLGFQLLSDPDAKAIQEWGLLHAGGKPGGGVIARPAAFLVEPDGTISWRNLTANYRIRVRSKQYLEALHQGH